MHVLVAYASHFGSTAQIARRIGEVLGERGLQVTVAPLSCAPHTSLFDAYVVGSAIHGSHWLPEAMDFVRRETALLSERPTWLFSSGPVGDTAVRAMSSHGSSALADLNELNRLTSAVEHRTFAGAYDRASSDFSGLGLLERTVVRRFLPDGDWRDWPAIEGWAETIAARMARVPQAASVA